MTLVPILPLKTILFSIILLLINNVVASELPVEAFSRLPNIQSPVISPNGSKIAYIQNVESPDLTSLMYFDLKSGSLKILLQTDNVTNRIKWYKWVNNETLLFHIDRIGPHTGKYYLLNIKLIECTVLNAKLLK